MLRRLIDWWNRDKNVCAFITVNKKNLARLAAKLERARIEAEADAERYARREEMIDLANALREGEAKPDKPVRDFSCPPPDDEDDVNDHRYS